jgi:hypothetical protein
VALLLGPTACAVQATYSPAWAGHERAQQAVTVGGTMHAYRKSAGIVGVRVGTAIDHGLLPRQAFAHGGLDWRAVPGWIAVEPGLDLGLGGPLRSAYSGVGAYAGAALTARLRVLGTNDEETAFNVIAPAVELVLVGRGGGWMPPEGAESTTLVGEWSAEVGVRFALGSDVFSEPAGKVQEPRGPASRSNGGRP